MTPGEALPVRPPLAPMEAESAPELPHGSGWLYEPKWDGFRCLAFKSDDGVRLQSKSGQPLERYFPDIVAAVGAISAPRFALDGELVISVNGALSFSELQLRLHPAASRVQKLARAHPAAFILFDMLMDEGGQVLLDEPLATRKAVLDRFAATHLRGSTTLLVSPLTRDEGIAAEWLARAGTDADGVVAKRADAPYLAGERRGMVKVKRQRTADCVVGGFRYVEGKRIVASLLLGMYGEDQLLHHVGFLSALGHDERLEATRRLEPLKEPPGFTGRAPGGPSRWSRGKEREWEPVRPELVVEVGYDHVSEGRFRHGTRFVRWRPDKAPRQCLLSQMAQ